MIHGIILMWYFFSKYQTLRLDTMLMNDVFYALVFCLTVVNRVCGVKMSLPMEESSKS